MLILVTIQAVLGLLNYLFIYNNKRLSTGTIHKFKLIHRYVGIFLTLACYISLTTGYLMKYKNLV